MPHPYPEYLVHQQAAGLVVVTLGMEGVGTGGGIVHALLGRALPLEMGGDAPHSSRSGVHP